MKDVVTDKYSLLFGNCLERMKEIPDGSVDLILTDPPYGTTACKWDSVIPFEPMWNELKRIIKPNGAIVLFGSEPFSSHLRMSNIKQYKYDWVWEKSRALGFTNAKNKPMNKHECISVFSSGTCANGSNNKMPYHPQGLEPFNKIVNGDKSCKADGGNGHKFARKSHKKEHLQEFTNYPTQILKFNNEGSTVHPTQKPVALLEYLIKTYTQEGETVLDFTAGSMSTAIACVNTNRKGIMIEKDEHYFKVGSDRVAQALQEMGNE